MNSLPTLSGGSTRWASSPLPSPQFATPLPHLQESSPVPTTSQEVVLCSPTTGYLTSHLTLNLSHLFFPVTDSSIVMKQVFAYVSPSSLNLPSQHTQSYLLI